MKDYAIIVSTSNKFILDQKDALYLLFVYCFDVDMS